MEVLGIIDRGVGGLGFYKKLKQESDRPIIYFADNANLPYGLIPKEILKARLDTIINHLKSHGATKIVFACNSASVVYPDSENIKGIIPFGVEALLNSNAKNPALIATKGTVKSKAYQTQLLKHGLSVPEIDAQEFAVFVEDGVTQGDAINNYANDVLTPIKDADAVLMACTHFPAIKPLLQSHMGDQCQLLDPVDEMVPWIKSNWPVTKSEDGEPQAQFHITGSISNFIQSSKTSFDVHIEKNQTLKVDDDCFQLNT